MSPRARGLSAIAISALCFAVMSVLAKLATDGAKAAAVPGAAALAARPLTAAEAVFYRSVLGWLGLLAAARVLRSPPARESRRLLALRGILGGLAISCYFYALAHTSVSKAALIGYAYPVFAVAFAWMFLGERLGAAGGLLMAASLAGVVLMCRPDSANGLQVADAVALLGSVFSGGAIATLRRLRRSEESTLTVVLHFTFWCTLVSLPLLVLARPRVPDLPHAALMAALAAVSALGQLFLTEGYRWCRTSEGSTLSLLNAVFTVAFGVILLGDALTWTVWLGGGVTLAACAGLVGRPAARPAEEGPTPAAPSPH